MTHILETIAEASRRMWRNRAVTIPVALSLALGIGANTAIFTLVDALFLAPLPLHRPDRLVSVFTSDPRNPGYHMVSFPNYGDIRKQAQSFEHLAATVGVRVNFASNGEVAEVASELVTDNYFPMLGVQPALGQARSKLREEESVDLPPVVVSHAFWRKHLAADPEAIGKTVTINRIPFSVAAVMPSSFKGIERIGWTDVWLPLKLYRTLLERPDWVSGRRALMFYSLGRLKDGITLEAATAEVKCIGGQLEAKYPETNAGRTYQLVPLEESSLGPERRDKALRAAAILMGAAAMVLIIAIANAGNVLLSRLTARRREMAVRIALGATRRTLVKQVFVETSLLVTLGGALGLLAGIAGRQWLWQMRPSDLNSDHLSLAISGRVLLFAVLLSVVTGCLASLIPALKALRGEITSELRERFQPGNRWWQRLQFREGLVVAQVTLSMVALVGADIFLKSLSNARSIDPGFDTHNIASFEVNPRRLGISGEDRVKFYLGLQQKLAKLDGVASVTISANPLFGEDRMRRTVLTDPNDPKRGGTIARINAVSSRYFATADVLVLRGRDFLPSDDLRAPMAAIVNETMARSFWPGQEAIGKRFRLFGDVEDHTVVGVARDSVYSYLGEKPGPCVYVPLLQNSPPFASLIVRTDKHPSHYTAALAAAVRAFHPELPKPEVTPVLDAIEDSLWAPRMAATLLSVFGVLALILASVGVYAITAQMVTQRSAELGVHMAMGACPVDVAGLILRQCFTLILPGLAIGSVVSFAIGHFLLRDLVYGVSQTDLEPYIVTSLLLSLVALTAIYLPARRVIRLEPAMALRQQ
ncbi:MAG: ABC transporter permease [Acidobacteria bacterium]|nr:ABC transporter permease [Acidobacteriota bacterium]